MSCPRPLDPVCVAILLRLSEHPASSQDLGTELELNQEIVTERLNRLRDLGAIGPLNGNGVYTVRRAAHRIILRIASGSLEHCLDDVEARDQVSFGTRLKRLQQEPMFQDLPDHELRWMARVSRSQDLSAGEIFLLEGDVCRALYIVDSGTIRLSKASSSSAFGYGREQTIRLMAPGESFNEVPVFDGGVNPVTAEALDSARVIVVPKKDVQDLVDRSPEFAGVIIRIMSQRLRHMLAMIEDVSMRDVTGRVAKILLQIQCPSDGVGAGVTLGRRLTQREIAEMAGTAREVVARILKKMERSGAVTINRGDVRIVDPELLESFT